MSTSKISTKLPLAISNSGHSSTIKIEYRGAAGIHRELRSRTPFAIGISDVDSHSRKNSSSTPEFVGEVTPGKMLDFEFDISTVYRVKVPVRYLK